MSDSKNVTKIFEEYREAARHLCNTAFHNNGFADWDAIQDFTYVDEELFEAMVLRRIPKECSNLAGSWKSNTIFKNNEESQNAYQNNAFLIEASGGGFKTMIEGGKDNGTFGHAINFLMKNDAKITFQKYFDWNQQALVDYRYYYGVIVSCEKHPEIIDRHVLIETDSAHIFMNV